MVTGQPNGLPSLGKTWLAGTLKVVAVIDDDASILDAMTLLIEGQGWEARAFSSAESFIDHYEGAASIDCVVLDPHLDGASGEAVAKILVGSGIPVIGLTARPESPVTAAIQAAGARAVLTKPASPGTLIREIEAVIQ